MRTGANTLDMVSTWPDLPVDMPMSALGVRAPMFAGRIRGVEHIEKSNRY